MVEKHVFMETLHLVQEIAKTEDGTMSREEAMSYFRDMELTPQQEELVYQFLVQQNKEAAGVEADREEPEDREAYPNNRETSQEKKREKGTRGKGAEHVSPHFHRYLKEVGHRNSQEDLLGRWMNRVVEIAREYQGKGVLLDDLVQEGNLGLLDELKKQESWESHPDNIDGQQLEEGIRSAIEGHLRAENGENQQSGTILAKVSLVHEAEVFLTEELGKKPSRQELAAYTKIPEKEIDSILSLVKEKRSV